MNKREALIAMVRDGLFVANDSWGTGDYLYVNGDGDIMGDGGDAAADEYYDWNEFNAEQGWHVVPQPKYYWNFWFTWNGNQRLIAATPTAMTKAEYDEWYGSQPEVYELIGLIEGVKP